MAVEPLYVGKALLLQKLRMSDTSDTDTLTIIDHTISDVRLSFYRRLGIDRVNEIVALPSVDNPTTSDEILRGVAEVTESYWVWHKLICILPTMFIETQFAIKASFDDVPITRDSESLQKFLVCIWNSVESGLGQMALPKDNNTGSFKSFSTGRRTPYLLGSNTVGFPTGTI